MKSMGYTSLPQHIEEAALLYNSSSLENSELGGLSFNPATQNRFTQYTTISKNIGTLVSSGNKTLQKSFGNTYWYYFGLK
jgi:hypothetical protein